MRMQLFMADIHDFVQEFNNAITLTRAKAENLRTSRNALRQRTAS